MKGVRQHLFCNSRIQDLLTQPTKQSDKERKSAHSSTKDEPWSELAHPTNGHQTNKARLPRDWHPFIPANYLSSTNALASAPFTHHQSHLSPIHKPIIFTNFWNIYLSVTEKDAKTAGKNRRHKMLIDATVTEVVIYCCLAGGWVQVQLAQDHTEYLA